MAELEIAPLAQRLEDTQVAQLSGLLKQRGVVKLPRDDGGSTTLGNRIDEDALTEFLDLLATHEAACDIYLPIQFTGQLDVFGLRVGTTSALMSALDELRGDLDITESDDDDDAVPDDAEMEDKLRSLWRLFQQGVEAAELRRLPLHVHS